MMADDPLSGVLSSMRGQRHRPIGTGVGLAASPSHTTGHTGPYPAVRRIKRAPVPAGGAVAGVLDGALGVIYALEAARALRDDAATRDVGVDVIAFCDEEGHFGSYLGSRSFIGDVSEAEIDTARDRTHGNIMRDALKEAGYAGRPRLRFEPGRYAGYFEAHIEQGRSLEASNLKIGVVTAIVGLWDYRFKVTGHQNHAGTTTMAEQTQASRWCG
jgi:beta-ureidopropionase / N-carbamoyl-L-amino-acid hydrolase